MLTLTQIYAEAWSQLDPDLADVIVTSLPQPRTPAHDTTTDRDALSRPECWECGLGSLNRCENFAASTIDVADRG